MTSLSSPRASIDTCSVSSDATWPPQQSGQLGDETKPHISRIVLQIAQATAVPVAGGVTSEAAMGSAAATCATKRTRAVPLVARTQPLACGRITSRGRWR